MRCPIAPQRHGGNRRGHPHLVERPWLDGGARPRDAFLQQQLGGLDARVGVKPLDHAVVEDGIGERGERHSFVMGKAGAHDDTAITGSFG